MIDAHEMLIDIVVRIISVLRFSSSDTSAIVSPSLQFLFLLICFFSFFAFPFLIFYGIILKYGGEIMDNSAIYKVLKYFKNEKKLTSDCLLKHHFLRKSGYDALNARLSELKNLGYISAKCTGNVIEAWITPYGLNFLANHKLMLTLKNRERFVTFILGIISGFILAYIFPFIFSFLL